MGPNRLRSSRVERTPKARDKGNPWAKAVRHLRRVDPHLRAIIDRVGPCRLEPHPDRFGALVRSIISQQISTKAAASINARLVAIGGDSHHPARLIELGEDRLRTVGLSSAKARYVLNLAEAVASGQVPLDEFDESWDDQAITSHSSRSRGSACGPREMFLIFALNRPDVLPAGDLGVRVGLRDRHGLADVPKPARLPCPGRDLAAVPLDRELVYLEGQRHTDRAAGGAAAGGRPWEASASNAGRSP